MGHTSNAVPVLETVTAGINETRFLAHMGTLFSTSTVVVAELMQNARRAGATGVDFEFVGEDVLVVTDDGCGIEDFAKLIVVAESNWSPDVMASDDPFGIGFASAVFAAASLRVESKGRAIELVASDMIEKRPVGIVGADFIGGTRITLSGLKPSRHDLEAAIARYARGFPIEVRRNGEPVARLEARATLPGEQTEMGWLFVPGIHAPGEARIEQNVCYLGMCYCQGLPVSAGRFTRHHDPYPLSRPVLHIDHHRYPPRVPDRDSLIDADKAGERIVDLVRDCWARYIERMKAEMLPQAFAKRFWVLARNLGRLDLMCDIDYLPPTALAVASEYPIIAIDGTTYRQPDAGVTRQQIEAGEVTLCTPQIEDLDSDDGFAFARAMYARSKGWLFVEGLPAEHWANCHVVDLTTLPCRIAGKVLATATFGGCYSEGRIKLMDGLQIVLGTDAVDVGEPFVLTIGQWGATYMVPHGTTHPSDVLSQASSYINGDDQYDEAAHDSDRRDFTNLVAVLEGEAPATTIRKCIDEGNAADRPNLVGRRFLIEIDPQGSARAVEVPDVLDVMRAAREVVTQHNLLSTATDAEQRATIERHISWWNAKGRHLLDALDPQQD